MDRNASPAVRKANLLFRKTEQAREGSEAWAEYLAQDARTLEKTTRLKKLRLAKEAAQAE